MSQRRAVDSLDEVKVILLEQTMVSVIPDRPGIEKVCSFNLLSFPIDDCVGRCVSL